MDLDDRQQFTNAMRMMIECADIVRSEIQKRPFSDSQADAMLLTYWRAQVSSAFSPDISAILRNMMPDDDDD